MSHFVAVPAELCRVLLHLDANRCGMSHGPYRAVMAEIRRLVVEQAGADGLTPEKGEEQ